ncbi:methyltransferase family protein [Stackebrandtia endophytica]|uniref:Methyltransferase family protein n=1 Tax=Stackebrandtia endophytica TaxID=1496996 RepID=A0A543AVW9_9ACTN|nr:class I SAM-dependent methyltransferase [Stackebrandtia endophytica]TQL76733.1 methyltransferase family protein [Stackebrandtia endophytica]
MKPSEVWRLGDYAAVGNRWAAAGEALADWCVSEGDRVLDVACGPGTMAMAAAARGATTTGLDISATLLDTARRNAEQAGLSVTWLEHDMTDLPFADGSFDRVLSAFGCMFAPEPYAMARELRRVCAPGGTIGVLAWGPESAIGRMSPLAGPYLPKESKRPAIEEWGRAERVTSFFAGLGEVSTVMRSVDITWPSLDIAVEELTTLVPGWVLIRSMLDDDGWGRLLAEVRVLMAESGHPDGDAFVLRTQYLVTHVLVS